MKARQCTAARPCGHRRLAHLREYGECWYVADGGIYLASARSPYDRQADGSGPCPVCNGEKWVQESLLDDGEPYGACPACGGPE